MLPLLRQTAHSVVTRLVSRQACVMSLHTSSGVRESQEEEALSVFNVDASSLTMGVSTDEGGLQLQREQPNLDIMHHYIPPAQSPILKLFTTNMMKDGKYALAAKTTSQLLLHLYVMTRSKPMPIIEKAVSLVSPSVRLRKQKQGGGKTVLKPMALSERQRTSMGIKWLIDTRAERLAREIILTAKGEGSAIKMKFELHKAAMVNRGNLPKRI
ncbi:ribosomal protein S7 domain-containing protein [Gymnopilus junonius]|uniref:Ribosomal protein S7 domain-containing protein n=1 Tax=Gymnopilus junonius TaxID=109634 RepID=A0A9P5NL18_GYMJU|nr:ribosomal protein S7 domain-containing protein [Gymnopilus junonius]